VRKFFALFFLFLFVVVFAPFVFLIGIDNTFFDSNFYKGEVSELAYQIVVEEFPKVVVDSSDVLPIFEDELREILADVLTKDDFSVLVDSFVEQLNVAVADSDGAVDLKVNLGWFADKNDLILGRAADIIVDDMDICAVGVVPEEPFPDCRPSLKPLLDFKKQVETSLDREIFGDLPNDVSFTVNVPAGFEGTIGDLFGNMMRMIFVVLFLTLLTLLIFIGLSIFRPFIKVVSWLLLTLFFASAFSLILVFLMFVLPSTTFLNGDFFVYEDVVTFMFHSLAAKMLLYLLPIFVVTLFLWIGMMFYDKNKAHVS